MTTNVGKVVVPGRPVWLALLVSVAACNHDPAFDDLSASHADLTMPTGDREDLSMEDLAGARLDCGFPTANCDPECPRNVVFCLFKPGAAPETCACRTVGHHCVYFEQELLCACDHLYHCVYNAVGGCQDAGPESAVCTDGG